MDPDEDAYGRAMLDHYQGEDAREIIERDDGWFGSTAGLEGGFDTLLMLGNNFGLVGTRERATAVLSALAAVANDGAVLYAQSADPRATDDEDHLRYHERNRRRNRLPGALHIRVRYRQYVTPWFDYLLASPGEMRELVAETPWTLEAVVGDDDGDVGVLEL